MTKKIVKRSSKIEHEKLAAILCYFLFGVIWFFVDEKMKKSSLVKFHTKQAINLWILSTIASIVVGSFLFLNTAKFAVNVAQFVLWIIGIVYASTKRKDYLPIIGNIADKYLKF